MHYCYILQSAVDQGYYIGSTSDVTARLAQHNEGKTKSLKHRLPLRLVHSEAYATKTEARKRELELKRNYQKRQALLTALGFSLQ